MAVIARRLFIRGRPPRGCGVSWGRNGSIRDQSATDQSAEGQAVVRQLPQRPGRGDAVRKRGDRRMDDPLNNLSENDAAGAENSAPKNRHIGVFG